MQVLQAGRDVKRVLAYPQFCKFAGHNQTGVLGFANYGRKSRALPYPIKPGIGVYVDKNILRMVHSPGCYGKRLHRYAEAVNIDLGDDDGWCRQFVVML